MTRPHVGPSHTYRPQRKEFWTWHTRTGFERIVSTPGVLTAENVNLSANRTTAVPPSVRQMRTIVLFTDKEHIQQLELTIPITTPHSIVNASRSRPLMMPPPLTGLFFVASDSMLLYPTKEHRLADYIGHLLKD